jgi:hypothetical protein
LDELPQEWTDFSEGQLVNAVQPLTLYSDGMTYKTKGVRVGRILSEKAYLEILLAEPSFSGEQIEEALRWETWQRRRKILDGTFSEVTGQPNGTWVPQAVRLHFLHQQGDALNSFGIQNAEVLADSGTLLSGDRIYHERGTFQVREVFPQGAFERARVLR